MSAVHDPPLAARAFVDFSALLRTQRFAVAPDQTQDFIAAVGLLGPRSMRDIYLAALATYGPSPERRDEFDALFRMFFLGRALAAPTMGDPETENDLQAFDDGDATIEPPETSEEREVGAEATTTEALAARRFQPRDEMAALRHFRRVAPSRLPRQQSRRSRPARAGNRLDMPRLLREAARRDGEVLTLPQRRRHLRQRRILLLVDVSGSMKAHTDAYVRFAHAFHHAAERLEVFTLGTRLTRISRALRRRRAEQALAMAGSLVSDWDGGTRLGSALQAFLALPRFAACARGALVVILSDGLERGDPQVLVDAVGRLDRLAWKILWLTPLAGDRGYVPQTQALAGILPLIDRLGDGSGTSRLCDEVLAIAGRAA